MDGGKTESLDDRARRLQRGAAAPQANVQGRWFCTRCKGRFDGPGDCPRCPEEPLLDLADDEIRLMLHEQDAAAKRKRYGLCLGIAAVLGVPVFFLSAALEMYLMPHARKGGSLAIGLTGATVLGLTALFTMLFPARRVLPEVSQADIARWTGKLRYSLPPMDDLPEG